VAFEVGARRAPVEPLLRDDPLLAHGADDDHALPAAPVRVVVGEAERVPVRARGDRVRRQRGAREVQVEVAVVAVEHELVPPRAAGAALEEAGAVRRREAEGERVLGVRRVQGVPARRAPVGRPGAVEAAGVATRRRGAGGDVGEVKVVEVADVGQGVAVLAHGLHDL
jgi:hypothetical protein